MILLPLLLSVIPDEIAVSVAVDRCALTERVPEALARVLSGVRIVKTETSTSGARFSLQISGGTTAGAIALALRDQLGNTALERELPIADDACTAAADGVALIVERHLRDLGWQPEPTPLPELPPRIATTTTATAATLPVQKISITFGAALFFGGENEPSRRWSVGGEARLRAGYLELAIAGGTARSVSRVITRRGVAIGELELDAPYILAAAGACVPVAWIETCARLEGGLELVSFETRQTSSAFLRADRRSQSELLAGARLRGAYAITDWFSAFVYAGLKLRLAPLDIDVEGADFSYTQARVSPLGGVGLALTFR